MVTILSDASDSPRISFQTSRYEVTEGEGSLDVTVERKGGDITQQSEVLVISTRLVYLENNVRISSCFRSFEFFCIFVVKIYVRL